MAEYMGEMHVVRWPCGHVVAACWVNGNEQDARLFKLRHEKEGRLVETLQRHKGDTHPEWCHSGCSRRNGNG